MKKLPLLLLPCVLLTSCKAKMSYADLIAKMKTYSGEIMIDNHYSSGFYSEEGFFTNNGQVVLYYNASASNSEGYLFVTLPNATSAPATYRCLYGWEYFDTSYEMAASFYIRDTYTSSTKISFETYNGYSELRSSSEDLAKSCLDLIITVFKNWVDDELNVDFSSTGLFPNY